MLEITKSALNELDALTPKVNSITETIVRAIPYTTVQERMKATVAVSQITHFASQFKRNIELPEGTLVPVNSIAFIIKGSGYGGDSSVKAAKKCFKPGFEMIEDERKRQVVKQAIKLAAEAGEEPATEYAIYRPYMKPIPPIDVMVTPEPGLIQHLNDIGDLDLSAPQLYSGEFSDELAYNPDMMTNIKVLSELYDTGDKEAKYTKGIEFRSKSISGQSVSALFVGSPGHILYDETTKKKFHVAFMSKLARRSWFCYVPDRIPEPQFTSVIEMLKYEEDIETQAKQARAAILDLVKQVTKYNIASSGKNLKLSEEAYNLFKIYKRYNSELVESSYNPDSTSALIRRHLQWKSLKLAGAFAILDMSDTIKARHYIEAMQFAELLDKDMEQFEYDLNKAAHERFSDFIRTQVDNETHKAIVNIHDIKKQGYLYNVSRPKLHELVILCSGYDASGIYSIVNEGGAIQYEPIIKTEVIGISFKPTDNTALNAAVEAGDKDAISEAKQKIAAASAYGFEVVDTTFAQLSSLLEGDFAYSPFKFRNGTRGKDNILGGTKWLVLDVDDSLLSASEAHFMLSDINHHIALSSDPNNDYKFRVLIELDSPVELTPIAWKHFYLEIASDLALKVDPLPQSQIFFSYADRPILSVVDASPLEIRTYAMNAKERAATKDLSASTLTSPQKRSMLADPLSTFHYLFDADDGTGSRAMYRAARHAQDLGATYEEISNLLTDANNYWISPMPKDRFNKILKQVESLF
jgi:hypothetical protein